MSAFADTMFRIHRSSKREKESSIFRLKNGILPRILRKLPNEELHINIEHNICLKLEILNGFPRP